MSHHFLVAFFSRCLISFFPFVRSQFQAYESLLLRFSPSLAYCKRLLDINGVYLTDDNDPPLLAAAFVHFVSLTLFPVFSSFFKLEVSLLLGFGLPDVDLSSP